MYRLFSWYILLFKITIIFYSQLCADICKINDIWICWDNDASNALKIIKNNNNK